jgi:hypothetical protein
VSLIIWSATFTLSTMLVLGGRLKTSKESIHVYLVILVWLIGAQSLWASSSLFQKDFPLYVFWIEEAKELSLNEFMTIKSGWTFEARQEPFFSIIQWGTSRLRNGEKFLLILAWATITGSFIVASKSLRFRPQYYSIGTLSYAILPFTLAYVSNTMRQGFAAGFLIGAVGLFASQHRIFAAWLSLVAVGFHFSALSIVLGLLLYRDRPLINRSVLVIWICALVGYLSRFNDIILSFEPLTSLTRLSGYTDFGTKPYESNRLDFLVLIVFQVILVELYTHLYSSPSETTSSRRLLMVVQIPFLLFGGLSYSDRFLSYSILVYPLVALTVLNATRPEFHSVRRIAVIILLISLTTLNTIYGPSLLFL